MKRKALAGEAASKSGPLIHKEFYDACQTTYVIDEQAYQLMPLMTGVVPDA